MSKTKTRKFRGSRTCGGGTHKNRRGAGNRGGRGNAGGCKHHFVRSLQGGTTYGKHGFSRPQEVIYKDKTINVGQLDEMADSLVESNIAKATDEGIHINLYDIGVDKLLGSGKVTKKFVVQGSFSKTAIEKIEAEGGRIVT